MLLALDVALLPPPRVNQLAIDLSAALPRDQSHGLRLDATHLPHITLTQFFLREDELEVACDKIDETLRGVRPLHLTITGGAKSSTSVSLAIENTPELQQLHERLMEALRGIERPGGSPHAFAGRNARVGDVLWVSSYRLKSSFGKFWPHITLGHAEHAPEVAPLSFQASQIAACHLGRFCSCHVVKRLWTLG